MKKTMIALLTAMVLCFSLCTAAVATEPTDLWTEHTAQAFADGDGSAEHPYQIATAEQLALLSKLVNNKADKPTAVEYLNKYYLLTQNIDLSGHYWVPIGFLTDDKDWKFSGRFDGNGYVISNMTIKSSVLEPLYNNNQCLGLFGGVLNPSWEETPQSWIRNVGLDQIDILCDAKEGNVFSAGGLVGHQDGSFETSGCWATGSITANSSVTAIGGLVGRQHCGSYCQNHIKNSYFSGTITGRGTQNTDALVGGRSGGYYNYCVTENLYYNSTATTVTSSYGTGKTEAEIKTPEFAQLLGSGWNQNAGKNNGLPYQKEPTIIAKITVSPTIAPIGQQIWSGSQLKPDITVNCEPALTENVDYTISYGDNISGTGSVTISPVNSSAYTFSDVTETFDIHAHSFGPDWQSDSTNHWHECSCGEKADKAAHSFEWIIDKEATKTETGSKHEQCSICGYAKAPVEIPIIPPEITNATVTFKIVNGTWDGKDSTDKTVTVTLTDGKGTLSSADIPTGMKPNTGYEGGKWDKTPATEVTGDVTYTHTFEKKSTGDGGSSFRAPTYSITVGKPLNGKISASDMRASKDEIIKLTIKAEEGYELAELIVTDSKGKELKLTEKDGMFTFKMPASKVNVEASFRKNGPSFDDVPADAYFAEPVAWAVKNGVTVGEDAATFAPDASCTRAQAVTFLWRASGSPEPTVKGNTFTDVPAEAYYAKAVLWAIENGVTNGLTESTFAPNATCTRAQIVTFLWRSLKKPVVNAENPFSDVAAHAYYKAAVLWAVKNDVTKGVTENAFQPNAFCTRAQIVTFLYRALSK